MRINISEEEFYRIFGLVYKSNIIDKVQNSINYLTELLEMNILIGCFEEDERERFEYCLDTLKEVKEYLNE